MAEKPAAPATAHDGRFGARFDDELHMPSVIWVTVGIAGVTAVGFLVSWFLLQELHSRREAAAAAPPPVTVQYGERLLPPGPRLQASPEQELVEMRREIAQDLHGWGWVDEAGGVVRIPVERAIDLVLESGLPKAPAAAEEEGSAP